MMMQQPNLVVIGGGAAGFFCAVNAARLTPGLRVTLLEKTGKLLQKVRISGGGRCNVTHFGKSLAEMARCYPRGEKHCKAAFRQFFVPDTIAWFQERGVQLKAEADGRMFPVTDRSETIVDCLMEEARTYGVHIRLHAGVEAVVPVKKGIELQLSSGETLPADYCCIAPGGFPKAAQYDWITRHTGHSIAQPVPSLFTFNLPHHPICRLQGLVVPDAGVSLSGTKFTSRGPVLVTHWGLSGPGILRTSAFAARHLADADYHYQVRVHWLPDMHEQQLLETCRNHRLKKPNQKVVNTEWISLPERLRIFLLEEAGGHMDMIWGEVPAAVQNKLAKLLCDYPVQAEGKTTFKDEFVTAGGILTEEVDAQTMESKKVPGLYFAGEVLNVDGITGGFNFQHAWTSGMVAAQRISMVVHQKVNMYTK